MKLFRWAFMIALPIFIMGCSTTDYPKKLPIGFLPKIHVIKDLKGSLNCESAVFEISPEITEKFISDSSSLDFLKSGEELIYSPWSKTPANLSMATRGPCTPIFGDEYLDLLSSNEAFYTKNKQKFLLFDAKNNKLYYVFQGN